MNSAPYYSAVPDIHCQLRDAPWFQMGRRIWSQSELTFTARVVRDANCTVMLVR